jgi:predicted GIY-YIG superfamily endonuclease
MDAAMLLEVDDSLEISKMVAQLLIRMSVKCSMQTVRMDSIHEHDMSNEITILSSFSTRTLRFSPLLELGNYQLTMAIRFNPSDWAIFFRWSAQHQFWCIDKTGATRWCDQFIPQQRYGLLVYHNTTTREHFDDIVTRSIGGQRKVMCANHKTFLVKEPKSSSTLCTLRNCSKPANHRCLHGLGNSLYECQCSVAVCLKHFRLFCAADGVTCIDVDVSTLQNVNIDDISQDNEEASDDDQDDDDDLELDEFVPLNQFQLEDDELDDVGINGQNFLTGDNILPSDVIDSTHTRKMLFPINSRNSTQSHCLLNETYGLLKRRYNKHASAKNLQLMHQFVTRTASPAVSLLFPESVLFPSIFWYGQDKKNLGAVPCNLLKSEASCMKAKLSTASPLEHTRIRLRDGDIATSHELNYLHWAFDTKLNNKMNHKSASLIFRRGLEHLAEEGSMGTNAIETPMQFEELDSTRKVKELAAMLKKHAWKYFLTFTSNQRHTMGLAPLVEAMLKVSDKDYESVYDFNTILLNRAWERVIRYFIACLRTSPEQPIGPVKHIWARVEFQGQKAGGYMCHVHAGVSLHDEPIETTLQRVVCRAEHWPQRDIKEQFSQLLDCGLVDSVRDVQQVNYIIDQVTVHCCSNARERCMKIIDADGNKKCRVPSHPTSSHYWFEDKKNLFNEKTCELLHDVGLAAMGLDWRGLNPEWKVHTDLVGGRWHYPTVNPPTVLPTIPIVGLALRSSTNVQVCNRKFMVSYLISYISGKEERRELHTKGTKDPEVVEVQADQQQNVKLNKKCEKPSLLREVGVPEMIWFTLDFPYVISSCDFVHVNTNPPEYRAFVIPSKDVRRIDTHRSLHAAQQRLCLPQWRQFTANQQRHITQIQECPGMQGLTEKFNIRPPELLIFSNISQYYAFFTFTLHSKEDHVVHPHIKDQRWLNGVSQRVKLRLCAVDEATDYLRAKGPSVARNAMLELFQHIQLAENDELRHRFVDSGVTRETIPVLSTVVPTQRTRFLYHLSLSLGNYETEFDLSELKFAEAFQKVGLIDDCNSPTIDDVNSILKRYVDEQLQWMPVSAALFSTYLHQAKCAIHDVLVGDGRLSTDVPSISEIAIRQEATARVQLEEEDRKRSLVVTMHHHLQEIVPNLPSVEQFIASSLDQPLIWNPTMPNAPLQSQQSAMEQTRAFNTFAQVLQDYKQPSRKYNVPFLVLAGPPGSGKTTVFQLATLYAIARGFTVTLMSITSERARTLGGTHVHIVFPIPVNNATSQHPQITARHCINSLHRDPAKLVLLQRTHVFFIEEIGFISAEQFSILDSVMKNVMCNDLPFGGKLVVANGDEYQLPPIDGKPFWTSMHLITSFTVLRFREYVRAAGDAHLQQVIELMRQPTIIELEQSTILSIVAQHANFTPSWQDVPPLAVRIVSTRLADSHVLADYLEQHRGITVTSQATDEVNRQNSWAPANDQVSRSLDHHCLEAKSLVLFEGALMRMTRNHLVGDIRYSQGQLAMVTNIPHPFGEDSSITVALVPPGVRNFDVVQLEWPTIPVRRIASIPVVVAFGLVKGRRTQFPLRYYLANTIHRLMGETCREAATEISTTKKENRLWQREQLLVLLSRVPSLRNLHFVGNKQETLDAMKKVLGQTSMWAHMTEARLETLNLFSQVAQERPVDVHHPFLPFYRDIPDTQTGYIYLLMSVPHSNIMSLGQTQTSLLSRLREHNSGKGSDVTNNTDCHPWALLAFVCRFKQLQTEAATTAELTGMHQQLQLAISLIQHATPNDVIEAMRQFVNSANSRDLSNSLVLIQCGTLTQQITQSIVHFENDLSRLTFDH